MRPPVDGALPGNFFNAPRSFCLSPLPPLWSLSKINCPELGALCAKEAMMRAGITGDMVDEVIFGTHFQAGIGANSARQVALGAGCPEEVPAWTVNKNCGTGLKAINIVSASDKM